MGCLLKDKATNCIPHALQREMLELILPSLMLKVQNTVQPLIYVPFFNRVSGAGGFMFRAWWGRM